MSMRPPRTTLTFVLGLLSSLATLPGLIGAESPADRGTFARQAWQDTGDFVQAPARFNAHDWSIAGLWIAGFGVGMQADHRIGGWVANHPSGLQNDLSKTFEPFGQSASFAVLAGFAARGYWGDDPRALRTAQEGLEVSLLGAGLAAPSLKFVAGRPRPNAAAFGADPQFFNHQSSFPSGHTAQAFGVATVIAENYGADHAWVPWVAYGTAGMVGWQRVYSRHHNPTDVVAGAAIGYYAAQWVVRRHRVERTAAAASWEISPTVLTDGLMIGARRSF